MATRCLLCSCRPSLYNGRTCTILRSPRWKVSAPVRARLSDRAKLGEAAPPQRRVVQKADRDKLRAARKERAAEAIAAAKAPSNEAAAAATGAAPSTAGILAKQTSSASSSKLTWYIGFSIPTILIAWGIYDPEHSIPGQVSQAIGFTKLISSVADNFAKPAHDKLLPDWHQMPNVPHDIPVPHTLVLDLENTLIASTWDRKLGWRHARRPGVDKFLKELSQYYEIVLYSPSQEGFAAMLLESLDRHGCIMHRLFRDATHYKDGVHMKDLAKLNRNVKRIIVIDDDAYALGLNQDFDNLIKVKPYTDPHDRDDDNVILQRLIPFLIEVAREGYDDVPSILNQFVTEVSEKDEKDEDIMGLIIPGPMGVSSAGRRMRKMDANELVNEYERRIQRMKEDRQRRARRGLGALAGTGSLSARPLPELSPPQLDVSSSSTPVAPTSKEVVGAAPSPGDLLGEQRSGGGLMGWLNRRNKEKEEEQLRKMEKWNEVMMRKHLAKKDEAEKQKGKQEAA